MCMCMRVCRVQYNGQHSVPVGHYLWLLLLLILGITSAALRWQRCWTLSLSAASLLLLPSLLPLCLILSSFPSAISLSLTIVLPALIIFGNIYGKHLLDIHRNGHIVRIHYIWHSHQCIFRLWSLFSCYLRLISLKLFFEKVLFLRQVLSPKDLKSNQSLLNNL